MPKEILSSIIKSLRPSQWLKNLVVFGPILFSGEFFLSDKFFPVLSAFLIFSASSSSMYILNDIVDRPRDKLHFSKKLRPIASGRLPAQAGLLVAAILLLIAIPASFYLSKYLFLTLIVYLSTQVLYTFLLKNIIILDVLTISFSFMLRIFAGSFVVVTPLSSWLILTTMMLSLLLAVGKRRSELTLLSGSVAALYRKTLVSYPSQLLNGLSFMMATATLITYSLFTFNSPEAAQKEFLTSILPRTLSTPKLLMITIPVVVYGILRYLYLVFEKSEGESPEKVFLTDIPLFSSVVIWFLSVVFLLYFVV